jgi:hypothetical protein
MNKRLVVCCDGTWQQPDQTWSGQSSATNVVRLAMRIAKSDGPGRLVRSNSLELARVWDLLAEERPIGLRGEQPDPTQSVHAAVCTRWDRDDAYRPRDLRAYFERIGDARAKVSARAVGRLFRGRG